MKSFVLLLFILVFGPIDSSAQKTTDLASVIEPVLPAVVNVYTISYAKNYKKNKSPFPEGSRLEEFNELFEQFLFPFGEGNRKTLGSGFIIDQCGYIVTNHHVIHKADEINIRLNDDTEIPAKLVGSDPKTDIALLKIDCKKPLPLVKLGDSSKVRIGEKVVAIGNPFGLGGTVTSGIVSSKSRDLDLSTDGIVGNYIQTDAAINEGNSGGPLLNKRGEVIGVNTSIISTTGASIGIGFAVPSNTVSHVVEQIKKRGRVIRGILHISIQDVTKDVSEALGIKETVGALVVNVERGGAGDKAGLKPGDIIVEFDGIPVKNFRKLRMILAETPVGTEKKLVVLRSGKRVELICKIAEDSGDLHGQDPVKIGNAVEINGILFSNLTKELRENLGIQDNLRGVVVNQIKQKSVWSKFLKRGDLVVSMNLQEVANIDSLAQIYSSIKSSKKENVLVLVKRYNITQFITLPIEVKKD